MGKKEDNVYHNTVALLKEYRTLKSHCLECESSIEEVEMTKEAWEAYASKNEKRYEDYVVAAKRTKERTRIMVELIDRFLQTYKKNMLSSNDPNAEFRWKAIDMRYISGDDNYTKISMELNCGISSVCRWHKRAIEELGVYFFGIEGLKLEKLN